MKEKPAMPSRRRFLHALGAGSLALLLPRPANRLQAVDPLSSIFHVSGIPDAPFGAGGNRHAGVDCLLELMAGQGLPFYRSSAGLGLAGPQGMIAADDVVLIKINAQWKYRGCTNSDVVRGLVQRVLEHPDGFRGEVVLIENGQGRGSLDCDNAAGYPDAQVHANAVDESHSFRFLVERVFADARVSAFLLDPLRSVFIGAADHETDGYRRFENVSYPCFTTAGGRRIELREGVWDGRRHNQKLKLINLPVLKHHDTGGSEITASLKHMYGLLSMSDGHRTVRHYSGLGEACAKMMVSVRPPVLNVIDAIWVSHLALSGYPERKTRKLNVLTASQDPVALDHWTARHVLFPIDGNRRHDPGHDNIQAWLEPAERLINARGGLAHPEWGLHAGQVTRDESRMLVFSALASAPARLTLIAPNGGEYWAPGTFQEIAWEHMGAVGERVEVLLLAGARIQAVVAPTYDLARGALRWRVPAGTPAGGDYRVRVRSLQRPDLHDESDLPFAIGPRAPRIGPDRGPR